MVERFYKSFFNRDIFEKQKIAVVFLVFLFLLFKTLPYKEKSRYSLKDLQLDINKANKKQLISIPYIGEKTAREIISLREEKIFFKRIEQLKRFKNFKRFKYFLKIERKAP